MAGQPVRRIKRAIGDMRLKLEQLPPEAPERAEIESELLRHESVLRRYRDGETDAVYELLPALRPLPTKPGEPRTADLDNPATVPHAFPRVDRTPPEWSPVWGLPEGAPEPLDETEFEVCRAVVLASKGSDSPDLGLLADEGVRHEAWLEEAFPDLGAGERVRAARFLAKAAQLAGRPPTDAYRDTVFEEASREAGLSMVAFEVMRKKDEAFNVAQTAVAAARKRAVMGLLEERLMDRAYNGQLEDTATKFGIVQVRKYDNALAFNLLKSGHDKYAGGARRGKKGDEEEGDGGGGMSLVIAAAGHPSFGKRKEPKKVEGRSRGE